MQTGQKVLHTLLSLSSTRREKNRKQPAVGHLDATRARWLADQAVAALVDEVTLTPKPGLVDTRNQGAHDDLTWALMCRSAQVLHATFVECAEAVGMATDLTDLRERIGAAGRSGECVMLRETGGVNTHRGAIWALGLLVTAAALRPGEGAQVIAKQAGVLARIPDRFSPVITGNKGEKVRNQYAVGGAKGQAEFDFPHVLTVALPVLRARRQAGSDETVAQLDALIAVMATLDDTCLLSRGGRAGLQFVQQAARMIGERGGVGTQAGRAALSRLETVMREQRLSPGGAADLLAAALLLDRIESARLH